MAEIATELTPHSLQAMIGQPMSQAPSPVARWLNGVLRAVESDGLTVEYIVRPEQCNPAQVLHGGMAATMMDDVVGASVWICTGRYHASVNLSVDYLAPARVGETLTARARLVRRGRRLVHADCTLTNAAGDLVARATTNLLAVDGA